MSFSRCLLFVLAFAVSTWSQVKVQFKDDNLNDPKWIGARVRVVNSGATSITGCKAEFWIKLAVGRSPQISVWDAPGTSLALSNPYSGVWKVSMTFNTALDAGQMTNYGNGALVGIKIDNGDSWNKSANPSWISSTNWVDDAAIPLYSSAGALIWGAPPAPPPPPAPKYYTIQINSDPNGTSVPSGSVSVKEGDALTVQFTPKTGYRVKSVLVDGTSQGNPSSWRFDAVSAAHALAVSFEQIPSTQYQVTVDLGEHGKSNVWGAVLVPAGNQLNLRFQPDAGYVVGRLVLDGVQQSPSNALDLTVNAPHNVQVFFEQAPRFLVKCAAGGGGKTDPVGDQLVSRGSSQSVAMVPDPGYQIDDVVVDGVSKGRIPFVHFSNVSAAHTVVARFRPVVVTGANVEILHREEAGTDKMWSKPRMALSNKSDKPFGPFRYYYYYRVEPSQVPVLSSWSVPAASGEMQDLGAGNWRLAVVSQGSIAAKTIENSGNGNHFGLSIGASPQQAWDFGNDWSHNGNSGTWTVNPKIPVYDANGNLVFGSEPNLKEFSTSNVPNVQAWYRDEFGDANYLRARILIRNFGSESFSDFKVVFQFKTEDAKIPFRDDWYLQKPSISMQSLGDQVYRIVWDYTGVTVGPGSDWPGSPGTITGLHYGDWSAWDRSNDYSHLATPDGNLVANPKILIYDRNGRLVWGQEPPDDRVPQPPKVVQHPSSATVDEGGVATFQVQVVGDAPISYQWRRNGIDIPGANSAQYATNAVAISDDQDRFVCMVKNNTGSVVSNSAVLSVNAARQIPKAAGCPDSVILVPQGGTAKATVFPQDQARQSCTWIESESDKVVSGACQLVVSHPGRDREPEQFRALLKDGITGDTATACRTRMVYQPLSENSMVMNLSGLFAPPAGVSSLRDTTVDMVVRLYTESVGGEPVYLEEHLVSRDHGVQVKDGRFSLPVGTGSSRQNLAEVVLARRSLHLELGLGDSSQAEVFLPRVPLTAVPWELGRTIQGSGEPTDRWSKMPVGTLYIDWKNLRTWRLNARGWKPLDF